jgi:uncharacterized delta-60 repeat protein
MRKGVKVLCAIVVLVVVGSILSVVAAENVLGDFMRSVAEKGASGNKDDIISDVEYRDYQSLSLAEIQSFLENWNSYLATYQTTDYWGVQRSAAEIIYNAAQNNQINPEVILTTLQKEQTLITTSGQPTSGQLDWAMGYAVGNDNYRGFGKQVEAAAWQFDHYWTAYLDLGNPTPSGWGVGITKVTDDDVSVTPENKATAAFYTYTPYAGYQWGGNDPAWGGNYLFWIYYDQFGFGTSANIVKNLDVPYIHQCWDTPNDFDGRWACSATSAVMAVAYYGTLNSWPCSCSQPNPHTSNYGNYISKSYTYNGHTFDDEAQCENGQYAKGAYGYIYHPGNIVNNIISYLQLNGLDSQVDITPTEAEVKAEIDAGYPVVALTWLTTEGHWVVIKGYTDDGQFIVNDPYGNKPYGYGICGNYNGADVRYTWSEMGVEERKIVLVHGPLQDTTKPTVDDFDVTPASVTSGDPFTISYTVSDTGGSGLKQVELWRATDVNNDGEPDWPEDPKGYIDIHYLSGNGPSSGSFSDAPSLVDTYWYGIHVVDNAGHWSCEPYPPGPISRTVKPKPALMLPPPSQNFGNAKVDQLTPPYSFTLKNTGGGTATGTVFKTGNDADDFIITSGEGGLSLGPGDTKTLAVKFCPDSAGVKSATLYAEGSNCDDVSSSLSGTGVSAPKIFLTPLVHSFFNVRVEECSLPSSFTLWNVGGGTVTGTVSITGDDADEIIIASGGGDFSLDIGDTKAINVKFCPDSVGVKHATLCANGSNCNNVSTPMLGGGYINYSLTISSTGGGSVTEPGEGTQSYKPGTELHLIAIPDSGYQFVSWTGDVSTMLNPSAPSTYIKMYDNSTITANFEKIPPSLYWVRSYRITDVGGARAIQQTLDDGYIVVGTEASDETGEDFWVVKLDSNGDIQWEKTYGGPNGDNAWAVQQTSDSGYIVAGYTGSFGGSLDFWVLKLDSTGNIQWQKTYGGNGFDGCYSPSTLTQTLDGGYIIAGYTNSYGAGNSDFWVLKLDSTGDIQWQKTYGGAGYDKAYSIKQTSDEGYIIAGETESFGAENYDFWVIKLNSNGVVQWQKTYGGNNMDIARSIAQTSNGGFIVAGETYSFEAGSADLWILKLDPNGDVQWQKAYGGSEFERAWDVLQTSDGGYIATGQSSSFENYADFWLLKLDSNGNITWERTFGGTDSDYAYSVNQTSDGYVVAGWAYSLYSQGGFCVLKLNSDGLIPPYCPLLKDSKATVTTTEVTVGDTSISGVDTYITPDDTYITPVETHANVFQHCPCQKSCNLTVDVCPNNGGKIKINGVFVDSYPQTNSYEIGDVVSIGAVPTSSYQFVNWSGDTGNVANRSAPATTITITGDDSITANFAFKQYYLNVSSTAGGSLTSPGEGTYGPYNPGETVNLVATAGSNYHFSGWTGDTYSVANSSAPATTITLDRNYSITANFALNQYHLTISRTAAVDSLSSPAKREGNSSRTTDGSVITPGEGTYGPYNPGETVNIVATAEPDYHFIYWTGDTGTIGNPNASSTAIILNGDYNISAYFEQNKLPNKPSTPSGANHGVADISYLYSTSGIDPDGDNLSYWYDWGDGTNSSWIGPSTSGTSVSVSKAWCCPSSYSVNVKARDVFGAESPWSDSLSICMNGSWEDDPTSPCKEKRLTCPGAYDYRNKSDGTICGCTANNTLKSCINGTCLCTGICNADICNADYSCDGKKPEDECDTNSICNVTCKCQDTSKPPIANFTYSPKKPIVNQTITFDASVSTDYDGNITTYDWTFGDGNTTTTTEPITTYSYSSAGDYIVNLMVTDDDGAINSTSEEITVSETSGSVSGTITYASDGTGIEGATVKLTQGGAEIDSTTTDASGKYEFSDVSSGDYYVNASKSGFWENAAAVTVTEGATTTADMMLMLKGDFNNNGAVDIGDVAKVANMVVGNVQKDLQADFNGNGDVDIGDAAKIANYFVGNIGAL